MFLIEMDVKTNADFVIYALGVRAGFSLQSFCAEERSTKRIFTTILRTTLIYIRI